MRKSENGHADLISLFSWELYSLLIIYFCKMLFDHDFVSTFHNEGLLGHKTSSSQSRWTHYLTQYGQIFCLRYVIWLGYQWKCFFSGFSGYSYTLFKINICNETVYFDIYQNKSSYWSYYYTICSYYNMHYNVPCLNSITSNLSWHLYSCLLFFLIPPRTVISNGLIQSCSLEWGLALMTSRESVLNFLYCKWDEGSTVSLSRSTIYFIQKRIIQKIHNQKTSQKHSSGFLGSKFTKCTKILKNTNMFKLTVFASNTLYHKSLCQSGEKLYKANICSHISHWISQFFLSVPFK